MASLKGFEIGINFIVIIVVAVLILTLGITWIQGVFSGIEEMTSQVTAKAKDNLMQDLTSGDAKMGFTVPNKVLMEKGKTYQFGVGVKNENVDGKCFSVFPTLANADNNVLTKYGCQSISQCTGLRAEVLRWFVSAGTGVWINGQEVGYTLMSVVPPKTAAVGRYIFRFSADFAPAVTGAKVCDDYTGDFETRLDSKQLEIEVR